ncbi:MAG: TolB family protein, partial [Candidatus Dadabacteria bacterium]
MSPKVLFSSLLAIGILSCQKPADLQVSSATVVSKATPANNNMDRHDRSVLFISDRDGGDYDVFAMNPDGSNLVQLTSNTVADGRATWSANGQLIAFLMGASGNRDIYVMNANGQG